MKNSFESMREFHKIIFSTVHVDFFISVYGRLICVQTVCILRKHIPIVLLVSVSQLINTILTQSVIHKKTIGKLISATFGRKHYHFHIIHCKDSGPIVRVILSNKNQFLDVLQFFVVNSFDSDDLVSYFGSFF